MNYLRPKEITYKLLVWLAFAALGWLVAETFVFFTLRSHIHEVLAFHAATVVILVSTFAALYYFDRGLKRHRRAQHQEALDQVRDELEKAARHYKALLEGAGNAIFIFDAVSGRLLEVNRKGTELLGFTKEELLAQQGRDLVDDESKENFITLVRRVVRRGRGRAEAIFFRRKNGERFVGEIEARHLDLGDEKVVHAIVRNVTFKHRAEKEIRQRNRELTILNTIIAHANESLQLESTLAVILQEMLTAFGAESGTIHLVDPEGRQVLAASEGLSAATCRDVAEALCPSASNRYCTSQEKGCVPECSMGKAAAFEGWERIIGIPLFLRKRLVGTMHLMGGGSRSYSAEEQQFFITLGNQIGIVIEHVKIVSELHWKNDELLRSHRLLEKRTHQLTLSQNRLKDNLARAEQVNQEMSRLDQMKNHFLGMISHEFKTPLTGILGSTELLLAGLDDAGQKDRSLIEMIQNGGKRLNEIVNDLLKVAKLENRSLTLQKAQVLLPELLQDVTDSFHPLVSQRRQRILLQDIWHLPPLFGDREYLREVFSELLENAIKFTRDNGTIVIDARLAEKNLLLRKSDLLERFCPGFMEKMGTHVYLQIEVRDTGIGIASSEQTAIFDKFYEAGEIRHHFSSKYQFMGKGTGLGLTIVKGMVEAHGGMIWVESSGRGGRSTDPGSSFFILFPTENPDAQISPAAPELPFIAELDGIDRL